MNKHTGKLLSKAQRAIEAASVLLEQGSADFAAGRAYHAMFYAAEALLSEEGLSFKKHSGVHAAFGEHFAKAGRLDQKLHRWLLDAFDRRIQGDYGVDAAVTAEDAATTIAQAREFLATARAYLKSKG